MEVDTIGVKPNPSKRRSRTPHWETWASRPNCHLADAVALTLNINPSVIELLQKKAPSRYSTYLSRLKTASLATTINGPIVEIADHPECGDDPYDRIVSLTSFVAFASNQDNWRHRLPPQFLQLGNVPRLDQPNLPAGKPEVLLIPDELSTQVTVQLPHITEELKAIFQVMRDNWSNYNPERLPKQSDVASQIDKALGWNSQKNGDASRNAQVFASAMRPDELKMADRRAKRRSRIKTEPSAI